MFKRQSGKNKSYVRQLSCIAKYLIPSFLLVFLGIVFFSSAGRDDAYIAYWSSYSLARFGEILNYNGERVEQGSSLLQVLVLAFINALSGINIASLGKILSVLCGVLGLAAVYRLALKVRCQSGFYTALLTATSVYFIYWSFGGLESTIVSLVTLLLILSYGAYVTESRRIHLVCSIVVTPLFATVRPEMPIVLTCILVGTIVVVYLKKHISVSNSETSCQVFLLRLFKLLGISIIICMLVFAFRIWYFNSLFPQPVSAKSEGVSWMVFKSGAHYFLEQTLMSPSMAIIALVTTCGVGYAIQKQCTENRISPYILLSLLFLGTYISFIFFSGGDWMEGGRFLVHMLPVAVMFIPFLLNSLIKSRLVLRGTILLLFAVQMQAIVNFAKTQSTGMPVWDGFDHYKSFALEYRASDFSWFERTNRVNMRDIPAVYQLNHIVERLLAYKNDEVHIMSMQMGMVAYYIVKKHFGRVRTVDMRGLTDRIFTGCDITSNLPRSQKGLDLTYQYYFTNREAIEKKSGLDGPDIIFDLFGDLIRPQTVVDYGYRILYVQIGKVHSNSKWLPGRSIFATQFIAVRNDLEVALADFKRTKLSFQQLQP
ncbi:MAG: hypothetical protein JSV82_00790 [Planctomycetota bacterium]|nr:MAG: hypothetical protein JSV82_00790 [Planctomycetota bacterium]